MVYFVHVKDWFFLLSVIISQERMGMVPVHYEVQSLRCILFKLIDGYQKYWSKDTMFFPQFIGYFTATPLTLEDSPYRV